MGLVDSVTAFSKVVSLVLLQPQNKQIKITEDKK
jgi:hypothetical protein